MKIPLAWMQLTHEKMRLLIALAGISFADILMFMQFGFQDALFESSIIFHKKVKGDIFLISPQSTALIAMDNFSKRRLHQVLGIENVKAVYPIHIAFALWKNPENRSTRSIMVIGINPVENIIDLPQMQENLEIIKLEDFILFDRLSRAEFGPIGELFDRGETVETEVAGRRVRIGGLFSLGASFGADGNIITSDLNYGRIFEERNPDLIEVGVIQVQAGADPEAILAKIREEFYVPNANNILIPQDVLVLSQAEFIDFEKKYWQESTAIGFIFTLGAGMGFIVGMVIVYQILYTDVADHLPEYATLKAMGYTDFYLLQVVFQEAIILALVGYLPGFALSNFLYLLTTNATSLPVVMDVAKATTVLILTVIMCVGSGAIAVRKLNAADPADIF
ncbi:MULTISPECIES: ABC transporter permease DevC [Spirulina sp. CCY15215]|uniref:ABC transporter permease DevC n=1 Tax=Spirulina sp. CCY15215 TaxID=2767591 RepID=UPI00195065BB|nr:ABC transporter permease DevC [Spirulina major]